MMFDEIILKIGRSKESCENVITDGQFTCPYHKLLFIFDHIDKHLEKYKILPENCFAFACSNTLPGAIILLWLISRKRNFILFPTVDNKKEERNDLVLPEFCHTRIIVDFNKIDTNLESPGSYLTMSPNKNYSDKIKLSKSYGKVHLKTSGSMASPKLAMHSPEKLLGNLMNCVKRFQIKPVDRVSIPVPIYHMYGLGAAFLPSVVAGASIDLQQNTNIIRYLEEERKFNPNVAFLTPGLCEMFLLSRKEPRHYRVVITAGDRINENIFREFESRFGQLINLYGSTEMGAIATSDPGDPIDIRAKGFLKLMEGVSIKIKQRVPDHDEERCLGEVLLKYGYGFEGYVDGSGELMDQCKGDPDSWFASKDLGSCTPDGYLKILGRGDQSVNRNGLLVSFAEIEAAMEQIKGISRVMVVAKGETKRGRGIVAYCCLDKDATLNSNDIRSICFEIMPRYAIPDHVFVIKEFPRLPNGKIDRHALDGRNVLN